jgi:hypothetical protein
MLGYYFLDSSSSRYSRISSSNSGSILHPYVIVSILPNIHWRFQSVAHCWSTDTLVFSSADGIVSTACSNKVLMASLSEYFHENVWAIESTDDTELSPTIQYCFDCLVLNILYTRQINTKINHTKIRRIRLNDCLGSSESGDSWGRIWLLLPKRLSPDTSTSREGEATVPLVVSIVAGHSVYLQTALGCKESISCTWDICLPFVTCTDWDLDWLSTSNASIPCIATDHHHSIHATVIVAVIGVLISARVVDTWRSSVWPNTTDTSHIIMTQILNDRFIMLYHKWKNRV